MEAPPVLKALVPFALRNSSAMSGSAFVEGQDDASSARLYEALAQLGSGHERSGLIYRHSVFLGKGFELLHLFVREVYGVCFFVVHADSVTE
jgi:hypothetical protein